MRQQHLANGSVLLTINAMLAVGRRGVRGELSLTVVSPSGQQQWSCWQAVELSPVSAAPTETCESGTQQHGRQERQVTLEIKPPCNLWWPHELGQPDLYDLKVRYKPAPEYQDVAFEPPGHAAAASEISRRVGLRVVELVRQPISRGVRATGETFFFRINGIPIFAKGAGSQRQSRRMPSPPAGSGFRLFSCRRQHNPVGRARDQRG